MTPTPDTSREAVERLAADLCARYDDPWRLLAKREEAAATLRALLAEREALTERVQTAERAAMRACQEGFIGNVEAVRKLGLDAMEAQPIIAAVQHGEISAGRARELLRCWVLGTFAPDMLPAAECALADDVTPVEWVRQAEAERDAARAEVARLRQAATLMDTALASLWRQGPVAQGHENYIAGVDEAWGGLRAALAQELQA